MPEEDLFNDEVDVAVDSPDNVTVNEYRSSITVGEVETLDYGEDAYVTNVGTESDVILDFGLPRGAAGSDWGLIGGDLSDQTDLQAALDAKDTAIATKADANNAALTGTPTAPTAIDGTSTNQIATTAFVQNAITILNTSLQSYINTAVANVLKKINYNNSSTFSASVNSGGGQTNYTVPSDGYIMFTEAKGMSGNHKAQINGKDIGIPFANTSVIVANTLLWPVSAGDIVSVVKTGATTSGGVISGVFFPEKA